MRPIRTSTAVGLSPQPMHSAEVDWLETARCLSGLPARFRIVETERQPRSEAEAIPDGHRGDNRLNAFRQAKCTTQDHSAFNLPLVAFSLSGDRARNLPLLRKGQEKS